MAAKSRRNKKRDKAASGKEAGAVETAEHSGPRWWKVHFSRLLLVIAAIALVLRLAVSAQLADGYSPVRKPSAATDLATYQAKAMAVVDGSYDYKNEGFYYQPFYYAVFLPAIYTITGHDGTPTGRGVWGVIVVQSLLGAAAVWLVGMAFAWLGGRAVGLLAAIMLALARMHIFYTPFTMIAPLQAFWMALLLFMGLLAWRRHSPWLWGAVGLVAGLANLTRGNIVLMMPVILLVAIMANRRRWQHLGIAVVLLVAGFYLPQLPFSIVNYKARKSWVGPSYAAGNVLALGNTPEAPPGGRDPGTGAGPMEYPATYSAWTAEERQGGRSVARQILAWAGDEPLAFLELKWRTFLLFWHRGEIPNNVAIENAYEYLPPGPGSPEGSQIARLIHAPGLLDFLFLGGLGLAGGLLALWQYRRKPRWWLAAGLLWLYCGSIVAFYMLGRFRMPVLPLACGFGAWFLVAYVRRYRHYKRTQASLPLLLATAVLIVSLFTVLGGMDVWRTLVEPAAMRLARPGGVQTELATSWRVYDHGPYSFGGWQPIDLPSTLSIRKSFQLPPDPGPIREVRLRFATAPALTFAPGEQRAIPVEVAVSHAGEKLTVQQPWVDKPGINWIDIPIGDIYTPGAESLELEITLLSHPGTLVIFADSQRNYGRSQIDDQPVLGELVFELDLVKADDSPAPTDGTQSDSDSVDSPAAP